LDDALEEVDIRDEREEVDRREASDDGTAAVAVAACGRDRLERDDSCE